MFLARAQKVKYFYRNRIKYGEPRDRCLEGVSFRS